MDSRWHVESPTLDEIVMAYLRLDPLLEMEFNIGDVVQDEGERR